MKNLLVKISIAVSLLLLNQISVFAFYSDVPENHKYYDGIKTLYEFGRLPVEKANQIKPDEILTRKEFYKLLLTYGMAELTEEVNLPYSDIKNDSPYATYIQTAINLKILKPSGENPKFEPDKIIRKHEALKIMFETLGVGNNYFLSKNDFPFTDVTVDSVMAPVAKKAADLKILEKDDPKKFKANKRLTKGELIDYLHKIRASTIRLNGVTQTKTTSINLNNYNDAEKELFQNESFATFLNVWESLQENYYYKDKLNDDELLLTAIKAMVEEASAKTGDKYTVFEKPSPASSILNKLDNEYEGIGIMIELIDDKITIVAPFKGSPAEEAGLKANDIIIKVDSTSVVGETLEIVSGKIKGERDTKVVITVQRNGKELEIPVTRKFISVNSVETKTMTNSSGKTIGYVSLINFSNKTYEEFKTKVTELTKEPVAGLIIDLRNNPGGYLDVSVNIISLFTKETKVAVNLEYPNNETEKYKTNGTGTFANYKVVILINEGSASASEIVAGALQDYKVAKVIGQQSFGKGSVQELKQYADGSILKYTISRWLTPNGQVINEHGITPDKVVKNVEDKDSQLEAALSEF